MSFPLFSFNPTSIKNETMKYFEKRSTDMYALRYRCPNDEIFDPLEHLTSFKSVFLQPNNDKLMDLDQNSKYVLENVLANDLLTLAITDSNVNNTTKHAQANQKRCASKKQEFSSYNGQVNTSTSNNRKVHKLFDELTQNDMYSMNNSNDILKHIIQLIKEKNYPAAFEKIDKSINIHSQYELECYQILRAKKRDISSIIIYTALFGLLLSYSIHDEKKQYEYFDIISDYPIYSTDLPHFYHLIDEILLTNNGIEQLTLTHLLGFPEPFFLSDIEDNHFKNYPRYKRIKNIRIRSGSRKSDSVFSQMNKMNNLNRNDFEYDNDSFNNDDFDEYNANDYDYYDFDSDSENIFDNDNMDCYDLDYDNLNSKRYHNNLKIQRKMKKDFIAKQAKLHRLKKSIEKKIKKDELIDQQKLKTKSNNNNDISNKDKKGTINSQMSNNNNNTNNNNSNDNEPLKWKVISSKGNSCMNSTLIDKNSVAEIQVAPLLNVIFHITQDKANLFRNDNYFNYKLTNSSKVVNCNFLPDKSNLKSFEFNNLEYNYCCLPYFQQPFMVDYFEKGNGKVTNGKKEITFSSKFVRMTDSKETMKSISDAAIRMPMPILTCSLLPEDENDESLMDAIKSAIDRPNLFLHSSPTTKSEFKMSFKPNQERFSDLNPCPIFKNVKSSSNPKNLNISSIDDFSPNFDSSDDDFEETDRGFSEIMNFLIKSKDGDDLSLLSQFHPLFSMKDEKVSRKINFVRTPGTKTTTEIKKTGNGTTIITTTSNMKFHNNSIFKEDETKNQSSRSQKDKKKKPGRDGK